MNAEQAPEPVEAALVREPLRQIYTELERAVAEAGPVCQLSGRCCRFEEYGHTLFLSALEAAVLLADAPPPARPLDDGASCPWQDSQGHCTARAARPLGCRVYYCESNYQEKASELSEVFLGRLKQLADEVGISWNYAPLHRHLRAAEASQRFPRVEISVLEPKDCQIQENLDGPRFWRRSPGRS